MTDKDGDSRMRSQESGSEQSSRSSSMFPAENVQTPPQSQSQPQATTNQDTPMEEVSGQAAATPTMRMHVDTDFKVVETDEKAPGYAWKNRRALEEYEKCSELVLDKNFSLQEFGDSILDELKRKDPSYSPYSTLSGPD